MATKESYVLGKITIVVMCSITQYGTDEAGLPTYFVVLLIFC
jgi:hypothetical protein